MASTTYSRTTERELRSGKAVLFEVSVAAVAVFSYFLVRGLTESSFERARENSARLVRLEDWLGLGHEAAIQDAIAGKEWLVDLANWTYIWGHWPVIVTLGLWLVTTKPSKYRIFRNAFLISGGIGLIIFAVFPVAPPRLLELGLVDTVTERSHAYRVLQPTAFVNQYAAMPSLHFGWDLLVGIAVVRNARAWYFRIVGLALPVAMAWAVVATANHFLIDCVVGAAIAVLALAVAGASSKQLDKWQQKAQRLGVKALPLKWRGEH